MTAGRYRAAIPSRQAPNARAMRQADIILSVRDLEKVYRGEGEPFRALDGVSLDIRRGEILALLGPNGAGKTTLISTICGVTRPTAGTVTVDGFDIRDAYRKARALIGLVPQEITLEPFAPVANTVAFSRGLFGLPRDDDRIEDVLRSLSLWDKRSSAIRELSGGMKRRVLIAKALAHDPKILFLDEPTAGVDVELRRDMWRVVERLRADGVTVILTTHYIEEAEAIADRIAVIQGGRILLVEEKARLMSRMGHRELRVDLVRGVDAVPPALASFDVTLENDGATLVYSYDTAAERTGITALLAAINEAGLRLRDLRTSQSSLEDIFVELTRRDEGERQGEAA